MNEATVLEFATMDRRLLLRHQLAERLQGLREEKGWSVEETIARIGCSRAHYYKLESGNTDYSSEMLVMLARAFGLDAADFFICPKAKPDRHGLYDLLRRCPEPMLLRTRLWVLEQMASAGTLPVATAAQPASKAAASAKRSSR
jgi:transcriptional regulator with XRE-family HTH domain